MNQDKQHILYAEDDVGLSTVIREFLEKNGFNVSIVTDGNDVLPAVLRDNPDLVLLDIMLPNNDGLSICQALRAANYNQPIVLFTANDSDIRHILGLDLGADDYLVKTVEQWCNTKPKCQDYFT